MCGCGCVAVARTCSPPFARLLTSVRPLSCSDGGGWTYVAEPGRSTADGNDLNSEPRHGYRQWVYDLRGMKYDEAMAERVTELWCGSWGYGSPNFIDSCSMGVAFDQRYYHYFNGNVGHDIRKQKFYLRASGGTITCSSCWVDSNGLLYV